ncbi:hypothetical protein, partial [Geobacillus thermocatenulatus]|uniref:hypothetical protein n=1 Tax=Geobacillus thermocatenulatus TaxID=33938 RepID=UPI001C11D4D3
MAPMILKIIIQEHREKSNPDVVRSTGGRGAPLPPVGKSLKHIRLSRSISNWKFDLKIFLNILYE